MIKLTAKIYLDNGDIIDINQTNMLSCSYQLFDRGDLKLPSFGIISNQGSIEFVDPHGVIEQYADNLLLIGGLRCEIFLTNTLVENATELIATVETDEWQYDSDNKTCTVSIKDDLEEWQDISVDEISYDPRNPEAKSFAFLYEHLWEITSKNYKMQRIDELDSETFYILSKTYMMFPLINKSDLWQQWTKLCEACQMHIYKDNSGLIKCCYNGGN